MKLTWLILPLACVAPRPSQDDGATPTLPDSQPTTSPVNAEQADVTDATPPSELPAPAPTAETETVSAQKIAPEFDDDGWRIFYNDVTALMEHRETITHVDVLSGLSRYKLRSLNSSAVARLRESIVEVSDLSDEPAPVDVYLAIYSSELDYALCAIPVGTNRLRLRPLHPFASDLTDEDRDPSSGVREVEIDPELFSIIGRLIRNAKEPDKMTTPQPRLDSNPYLPYAHRLAPRRELTKR